MTGFGTAHGPVAGGQLRLEVRSVNHRHFSLQLKLPADLSALEADLRERLRTRIRRGHVTVSAAWTEEPPRPAGLRVNLARARELLEAWRTLQRDLGLPGEVSLEWIAKQPDVLQAGAGAGGEGGEGREATPADRAAILRLADQATEALLAMRASEGAALAREVEHHLASLEAHLAGVERRAPERLVAARDRLRRAVAELADGARLDEARLAQEIALMAERLDIAEEIARLKSHLAAARAALAGSEPAGRQLGFLAQEMLREINTMGSKANDAAIAHAVIAMKGELERFREQVENLE
jgi:uncharacterized protein (TIGR00255 family)